MKTDDNRFAMVHDLFVKVVDLSTEHRDQLLRSECAGDPDLEKQVRALLLADTEMSVGKLTRAISAARKGSGRAPQRDLVGSMLGPYKLVSILGRGGAGIVYMGERADRKFSARVAIKVVEETADDILGARFAAEIQILATLNHPHIARLVDAGESNENYPYIVMEYVHGESLDRYSDDKALSIAQRLSLFLQVCSAVQYAHQNLVVHRDLKPGNILVTDDGSAKLLDFGIAKLLSTGATTPALTRLHDRALTPEYASPEQIAGRMVTTASDVYSLGVLLYELLSGLSPYDLKGDNHLEMERAICNVDPLKPSAAVARGMHPVHSQYMVVQNAAAVRRLSANRLRDALAGDLDAIVMRALRKEPEKRYASVAMLAEDLERFLRFEAVVARQRNWTYYSGRFLRRHWIPVSAASVVGVALFVSAIAMTLLYRQARVERDRAEQVSQFMSGVFADAHPDSIQGREITVLDLLGAASERLGDLSADPEVQARLRNQVGEAYLDFGDYEQAIKHLQMAADIEERFHMENPTVLATTLVRLASAEFGAGHFDSADARYREARRLLESQHEQSSAEFADLLRVMGRLANIRGDLEAAERDFLRSIELSRNLNPQSTELAQALTALTALYGWTNDLPAAERVGREALTIVQSTLPERHPVRVTAQLVLGEMLSQNGNADAAEAAMLIEKSVDALRAIHNNTGPQLAQSLNLLAWIKNSQGQVNEAEQLLRECLDISQRSLGVGHYQVGYYRTSLARLLLHRHRLPEAEEQLRASLEVFSKTLPKEHQYIASSEYWLGETLLAMDRLDDAITALTTSRDLWKSAAAARWLVARTEGALGEALAKKGVVIEAEKYLRNSYSTLLTDRGAQDEATRIADRRLQAFIARRHSLPAERSR